jgi:Cu/Ag efflux protein CusF
MLKQITLGLAVLALATSAGAQSSGGGGHHGGGKGGGKGGDRSSQDTGGGASETVPQDKPANQIEIVGVVRSIDTANGRITIDYEPVDALTWPRGSKPFPVEKPSLLDGVKVGEKVRFKLESSQIYELKPY